jgi:hypothetical protein
MTEPVLNHEAYKQYRKEKYGLKTEEQKQKHKEQCKTYYQNNRDERLKKDATTRETEEYKQRMKEYRQSEGGKKSARISNWKQKGVISDDYDALNEKWKVTTHCEECNVELCEGNKGKNKKILDHDHITGQFRNIICHSCNISRGYKDNGVVRQTNEQYNENRRIKYAKVKESFLNTPM